MAKKNNINKKANVRIRVKNKFANAARGIYIAFKEESTLIVYLVAILFCIGLGIWLKISPLEWSVIILTIGVLIGFEFVNTSIENLVDLLSFEYNIQVKKIKDICAAASILNALLSVVIGFLIYLPPLIQKITELAGG
ncbi:diacylglycerol kinase family protein [Spiroplasma taiwanense]|uniref:Diacylglycerol kinase n=1 Tax=Spiroplasma taiwanense CT-1 TaxID=1276220 RepID=S5MCG0_9MOLU|nr:diacylglycerol kinase family protein [Spiroplasma taiwanense]AGR41418.1 diacylglycerol kinase [Spiroplasma taiwanense CT-1]